MYNNEVLKQYHETLKNMAHLSKLFSESKVPYLVSRSVEKIYCDVFGAEDLGRADCSADAKLGNVGVGLKTFIHGNGKTLQKVAEFNRHADLYRNKSTRELVNTIASLRNERIKFTMRTYDLNTMIYHCITRKENEILIFEEPMDLIDINKIKNMKENTNTVTFNDGLHEYSFNKTKSTLYKRFIMNNPLLNFKVEIHPQPYDLLNRLMKVNKDSLVADQQTPYNLFTESTEYVVLPLFSDKGSERNVPAKSGLNQWNAGGRRRDYNEIYIPIPGWIHKVFPDFFPERDVSFNLRLPNDHYLSTKVCQDNRKALMSNPNKELGRWLLRDVLSLNEGELLTYEMLQNLDIDSTIIEKNDDKYSINFCSIGTYDEFKAQYDI